MLIVFISSLTEKEVWRNRRHKKSITREKIKTKPCKESSCKKRKCCSEIKSWKTKDGCEKEKTCYGWYSYFTVTWDYKVTFKSFPSLDTRDIMWSCPPPPAKLYNRLKFVPYISHWCGFCHKSTKIKSAISKGRHNRDCVKYGRRGKFQRLRITP